MSASARVDLHAHTNASDGEHSPEELVQIARARGVTVLGIADHDTVAGIARAQAEAARPGEGAIEIIPGVELSTDWEAPGGKKYDVHMLAYWIDPRAPEVIALARRFQEGRLGRARMILTKLDENFGVRVSLEAVQAIAGDAAIIRPHIAQAMMQAGYVGSVQEAFDRYLTDERVYVPYKSATPFEAVEQIRRVGGVPVLAHPRDVVEIVPALKQAGLVGLECYYAEYDEPTRRALVDLARQYGLIQTGGSDFHGLHRMGHMSALGEANVPPQVVDKLREAHARLRASAAG